MISKIKPCPWCGSPGIIQRVPTECCTSIDFQNEYCVYVECINPICRAEVPNGRIILKRDFSVENTVNLINKAIEKWNHRVKNVE